MPSHCAVCGHADFSNWVQYRNHMVMSHNVTVPMPPLKQMGPVKTTNRTTSQIVEALERKLGKHNFFNTTTPGLEDEYVTFMRRFMK